MTTTATTARMTRRDAITEPGTVEVLARQSGCRCGCGGSDSWHRHTFDRAVREVQVHESPVQLGRARWEAARGVVRLPWGYEQVRAVMISEGSLYAWWELIELRR